MTPGGQPSHCGTCAEIRWAAFRGNPPGMVVGGLGALVTKHTQHWPLIGFFLARCVMCVWHSTGTPPPRLVRSFLTATAARFLPAFTALSALEPRRGSRGSCSRKHNSQFPQIRHSYNTFGKSFFPTTAKEWNDLPSDIISSSSIESFKTKLSKYLLDH